MRFGLVHRLMTDALASLGVLALIVSGQFSRALDIVLILSMAMLRMRTMSRARENCPLTMSASTPSDASASVIKR